MLRSSDKPSRFGVFSSKPKIDLRELEPTKFAKLDVDLWRAYYNHQFFKMFRLILVAAHEFMGPGVIQTILYAYYASVAAIIFRKTKGHETEKSNARILRYLEKFYALIERRAVQSFDVRKAAKLELEWWFIDRYPERYEKTRAEAFAEQRLVLYEVSAQKLREYGEKRAAAMELLADYHHDTTYKVNWAKMERLLRESYQAVYDGSH